MGSKIDEQLINAGHGDMLKAGMIIETYFGRGSDELVNRASLTMSTDWGCCPTIMSLCLGSMVSELN